MDSDTELRRSIDRLSASIEKLEERVVMQKEYVADQRTSAAIIKGLDDDIRGAREANARTDAKVDKVEEKRVADRRLLLTSFIAPFLVSLLLLYVATQIGG